MMFMPVMMFLIIGAIFIIFVGAFTNGHYWDCGQTGTSELTSEGWIACNNIKTAIMALPVIMIAFGVCMLFARILVNEYYEPDLDITRNEVWQNEG